MPDLMFQLRMLDETRLDKTIAELLAASTIVGSETLACSFKLDTVRKLDNMPHSNSAVSIKTKV